LDSPQFIDRMAQLRDRFAAELGSKIEATDAALPILASDDSRAVIAVAEIYRRFHDMCGVGPIFGFDESGRAARTLVDDNLVGPFRDERRLSAEEIVRLKEGLETFRTAVRLDMQSISATRRGEQRQARQSGWPKGSAIIKKGLRG
jgi:hypothetical protein